MSSECYDMSSYALSSTYYEAGKPNARQTENGEVFKILSPSAIESEA